MPPIAGDVMLRIAVRAIPEPVRTLPAALGLAAALGVATAAHAQITWEVIRLQPPGVYDSEGLAAGGGLQGGWIRDNSNTIYPALWNGSAASYTNLIPNGSGFQVGQVLGMSGNRQVGWMNGVTSGYHAAMWSASADSFVSLNPLDTTKYGGATARGISGNQQVGDAAFLVTGGAREHACLWNGNAASFVDLHPSIARSSIAHATDGLWQGGSVVLSTNRNYAALWKGTAESFVNLNPAWADAGSGIGGMANGIQVGSADSLTTSPRAMLWRGTAESAVDMTPTGARSAVLYDTNGLVHVGYSQYSAMAEAGIWLDSSRDSFFNLHDVLGPGWSSGSNAYAVSVHGKYIDVVGTAAPIGGRVEAILWRGTIPAPGTAAAVGAGIGAMSVRRYRRGRHSERSYVRALVATGVLALPALSHAQITWEVIRLEPNLPEVYDSIGWAAGGTLQGGYVRMNDNTLHPALWNASSKSYVDLLPPGQPYLTGAVTGMAPGIQVGGLTSVSVSHPAMWRGTPDSFINLMPSNPAYTSGTARGTAWNQQVGSVKVQSGNDHACLWNGSAASFVDLHPSIAEYSQARATDGSWQGGGVRLLTGQDHAALWKGTAASFVDLNPAWAIGSGVGGMAPGVQVGAVTTSSGVKSVLWRGTAASAVDMTPSGSRSSILYATTGAFHAGYAQFSAMAEAGIWLSDSPSSFFNLHNVLGPGWSSGSSARAISVHGKYIDVVGTAAPIGGRVEAILWRGTIPAPGTAAAVGAGIGALSIRRYRRRPASHH